MIAGLSRHRWLQHVVPLLVFPILAVAMFHTVLGDSSRLVSSGSTDLTMQFLPWREFGFSQLRQGHVPLWNPFVFGGCPYFAGFQSALLYPLNWLHLFLSLFAAINWIVVLHVVLAGYFTFLWARGRGASVGGSLIAGTMFMFGGTYFPHVYAGHLPHLCLMVWLPLIFLILEKLAATGSLAWCWIGVPVVAATLQAGHPQYVFYTGIVGTIYMLLLAIHCPNRRNLILGAIIMLAGGCCITAIQLLSGLQASGESVRSGGVSYDFASMFGLPPENLLTFLVPNFFGKMPTLGDSPGTIDYFGRCYLWEMSLFVTITGFTLAIFAGITRWRMSWRGWLIIVITLLLSFGKHIPFIYVPLYRYFPMYGSFRDVAKFTVFLSLFLCVFAADGFDELVEVRRSTSLIVFAGVTMLIALLTCAFGFSISSAGSLWRGLIDAIAQSQEIYFPVAKLQDEGFIHASAHWAASSTYIAGGVLLAIAIIAIASRYWRHAIFGLVALTILEAFVVGQTSNTNTDGDPHFPAAWHEALTHGLDDERFIIAAQPGGQEFNLLDWGMAYGARGVWGYDPGVLKRYAELLTASQGRDPKVADQYLQFTRGSVGLFQMLRCRLVLTAQNNVPGTVELRAPLARAVMIPHYQMSADRDSMFAALCGDSFNPRDTVYLESPPPMEPNANGADGPATVTASGNDWFDVTATTAAPTLLLLTENYSTGWHATAIDSAAQSDYDILPANYTLMAIPLATGTHHLHIEYRPTAFVLGEWMSILSLLAYFAGLIVWFLRRRRIWRQELPADPAKNG